MTKLTFLNGLKEIGGTFVAVETDMAVCMFDFGFAVKNQKTVDESIKDYVERYIKSGMLSAFDGIYAPEVAHKCDLKGYGETGKESFFVISHMHIDHMGGFGSLDPQVPVYMSEDSLKLYEELKKNKDIQDAPHENCLGIKYGESITVGDITVTCIPVDHDVIGACGYKISTPDGTIAYTGDYRFHGFHPEVTKAFAYAVQGVDVMITEGVTVSHDEVDMLSLEEPEAPRRCEENLQGEMSELAKLADKLIVINPYNRNVERLHRLIHTYKNAGRTLVMDKKQADYVHAFYPNDEIFVYEKSVEGLFKKGLPEEYSMVRRKELKKNPELYVLQLDYENQDELEKIKRSVSYYVHMDGSPLGDYDPNFAIMKQNLSDLKINYLHRGLGGHAQPYYIRWMIDTIAPKTLVPLHSFRPEQVNSEKVGCRVLPEFGDAYYLANGQLTKV